MKSFKTTWNHIRRSPYQALAAILIMMLTFLALTVFTFIIFGSSIIINYFESKPQVTAFFKNDTKQEDINAFVNSLEQNAKIARVHYVSKQEAMQIYKKQNQDDPLLLDLVTEDILPASVEVSTKNIQDLTAISDTLRSSPIVLRVIYQKDVVGTLQKLTNALKITGITIIAVLVLVSIFIKTTFIGFKISQKKEEIEIMRLLSATKWYIRLPFILEGMFYGIFGSILGWGIASFALLYATPSLKTFLLDIPVLPVNPVFLFELLGAELLVAVLLGSFSSFLAVLRYLK